MSKNNRLIFIVFVRTRVNDAAATKERESEREIERDRQSKIDREGPFDICEAPDVCRGRPSTGGDRPAIKGRLNY